MTITNFDRFRLQERQQKQPMLEKKQSSRKQAQQAASMLMEQAQNSSASHYRDPRRLHASSQEAHEAQAASARHQQEDQTTGMAKLAARQSRPPGGSGAPASLRASSMTRHYQPPHQLRTLANQHAQQVNKQQQQIQQEVWTSTEELFWDHMREVQNKWNTLKLNDDIWAKLIYFERNRRLAKAYVSTPVLTLDGSTNGLDGFRIGLSGIENSYRDLDSMACLCSIGHGIKLKIDSQGNILIRKLAPPGGQQQQHQDRPQQAAHKQRTCSIWVKEWPTAASQLNPPASSGGSSGASSACSDYSQLSGASSRLSTDAAWPMYELLDTRSSYKLFDMQKFRARLERSQREAESAKKRTSSTQQQAPIDWRQCVSIISFVRSINMTHEPLPTGGATGHKLTKPTTTPGQQQQVLSDPCWLMLINIIAIDMLKSSVCDITSRPSPGSQTSALINRYEHERRPAVSSARPTSSSRLADGREASRHAIGSVEQRLRHGQRNQASLLSSLSSSSASSSANPMRLLAGSRQSSQPQLSQQDGSIYTTFTGKYLDKQQRLRQNYNQAKRPLHPGGNSVDDLRPAARRYTRHDSHLLYPVDPLIASQSTFTMLQRQQRQQQQQRDRYGRLVHHQLATGTPRRSSQAIGTDGRAQLSHSLSAFDLSHGHKLNLRSINSTSIRMNFSDSESGEHDDDEFEVRELEDIQQRASEQQETPTPPPPTKKKVGIARKAFERLNGRETSSEWTSLAKKFSLLNFKPIESTSAGQQKLQSQEMDKVSGIDKKSEGPKEEEANTTTTPTTGELQPNASRSSIVSSSSSSGCPDNDYIISQSSNSSMSSSTRSNGEELFSQPASSSGINCGSNSGGNTSDEYERQAHEMEQQKQQQQQQQQLGPENSPKEGAKPSHNIDELDTRQGSASAEGQTRVTTNTTNNIRTKGSQAQLKRDNKAAANKLTRRQNISLNRCYNVKTIDYSDNELESPGVACGNTAHHLSQGQLYHGTTNRRQSSSVHLQHEPPTLQLCDCGQPECDQYLAAVGATDGGVPCDCCCDCFYMGGEDALSTLPACCDDGGVALPSGV